MNKFSNAHVGDKVWGFFNKHGVISATFGIRPNIWKIIVKFDNGNEVIYNTDGSRENDESKVVELFWNEIRIPSESEHERPFNLIEFLSDNLQVKKFIPRSDNVTIVYNYSSNAWEVGIHKYVYYETVYLQVSENILSYVLRTLTEKRITPKELRKAYKKLKWL